MTQGDSTRHKALAYVRDEHRSMAAVVHALEFLAKRIVKGGTPDMTLLGAIVHYLTQFSERLHHPAEDKYLFAPLRTRTRESGDVIDALEIEHQASEERAASLSTALNRLAARAPGADREFLGVVDRYAQFYWGHMMREETLILPLAERVLSDADWEAALEGFRSNHDPMYANDTANEFETLFRRIVHMVPEPIGMGGKH
ncbi:MAG: hemerythrin domain-containing protein [Rhodocyclales bacterium]|nr:hemerythrin domain-containing protein [Rhodocyclales bacterium]